MSLGHKGLNKYFDSNFTEPSNWHQVRVVSGNGLAPNRQRAITWTNVVQDTSCHTGMLSLGYNELSLIHSITAWGGWGCEVSRGGHHRQRGKTTMGSALDGAVLDFTQILAYLAHNMNRAQSYLGFGHFGWLPSFFGQEHFGGFMVKLYFICWNYFLSSGWHIIVA